MPILGILPPAFLALIVYFAFSKHSNPAVKRAAVIALIVLGISMGVCAMFIFSGHGGTLNPLAGEIPDTPVQDDASDLRYFLIFGIVFLLFFALIFYISLRERKKTRKPAGPANS
jgi:4-hydroxybenzoate polyprenyltransferase